jgi:hypothetical protein
MLSDCVASVDRSCGFSSYHVVIMGVTRVCITIATSSQSDHVLRQHSTVSRILSWRFGDLVSPGGHWRGVDQLDCCVIYLSHVTYLSVLA